LPTLPPRLDERLGSRPGRERACGWWLGMPAPSGQIPAPWAWWNNEAPTTRAGVGPVPGHSQSVFAPPYFEPPLTPDGPGSWSMSGSSEMPSISSCPAARGRRSVSRDAPPVPAGLLKVRQVPPVVRAPARDPRRERLGRSRRSAKPVDRHQLVSKQDRGLGPDEHLADSAAIATLPLGPQPRNLTVNDADCSLERAGLVAGPVRALTAVGRVGSAVQQARRLIAATGMF
jgi:hypothetical protein